MTLLLFAYKEQFTSYIFFFMRTWRKKKKKKSHKEIRNIFISFHLKISKHIQNSLIELHPQS